MNHFKLDEIDDFINKNKSKFQQNKSSEISLRPYTYITQIPGKKIRSKIILAFNHWLNIESNYLEEISIIVQMIHNATLMVDDIEDNSDLRRGIPTAHKVYGISNTINSAYLVYMMALEKVEKLKNPEATKIYTQQLLELHRGQGIEIYWSESFQCPEFEEYIAMIVQKTGGLFKLAIGLMQLFSENEKKFSNLIDLLGIYFQIRDDFCNLTSKEYSNAKTFCEDLTEGKFSFPIIHAIKSRPDDERVLNILKLRTRDVEVKKKCIELLEEFGSLRYTREVLEELDEKIRKEVEKFGENKAMENVLDELLSWK